MSNLLPFKLPDYMRLEKAGEPSKAEPKVKGAVVSSITPCDLSRPGTEYRADRALAMAELANLAYDPKEKIEEKLQKSGYTLQSYHSVKGAQGVIINSVDTQAFIATKGDVVVLSFKGTEGFTDAMTDIAALFRRTFHINNRVSQVHRGFSNALGALSGQAFDSKGKPLPVTKRLGVDSIEENAELPLHEEVKRLMDGPPRRKLYITGHSLGAGVGTIEAMSLVRDGFIPEAVYTIGSPRVGDPAFQEEYDRALGSRTFRHINSSDAVTRVPFDENYLDTRWLEFDWGRPESVSKKYLGIDWPKLAEKIDLDLPAGTYGPAQYRHVGTEKYIDAKGTILDPPPGLGGEIWAWFKDAITFSGKTFDNHKSGNYIKALKRLADEQAKLDAAQREREANSFETLSRVPPPANSIFAPAADSFEALSKPR